MHAYQIIEIVVILHIFEEKILRFGKKSSFIEFSKKNLLEICLQKKEIAVSSDEIKRKF